MRFITLLFWFTLILGLNSCKDPCKGINCLNGGQCNDGSCICPSGYTGEYCQTEIDYRAAFIGTYSGQEICNLSDPYDYIFTITSGVGPYVVDIGGVLDSPVTAVINGNSLSIPIQLVGFSFTQISGSGTLSGNSITINYTLDSSLNCTLFGTK